ncbi:phosphotransferase [Nonomuraea phyllanthi]|uniref:phosphotransferase n=1 Tax=Nonomuraea phyllanthi TaxID=2219224 RepID=UPI001292E6B9|nr:phosphotransferase [Nonomuraea phyllanthi]QFY13693.1 phosphotransferase [Nonomuraea phyllanthi]
MDSRRFAEIARKVSGRPLAGVERLRGGSKKGVYRLSFEGGSSAILYVWSEEENYWPAGSGDGGGSVLGHASGVRLFAASQARLRGIGVRVPEIVLLDDGKECFPADVAVVEDVRGGTLEALLRDDPVRAGRVMDRLAAGLGAMAADRSPQVRRVAVDERAPGAAGDEGGPAPGGDEAGVGDRAPRAAVDVVMAWALKDLREAAARVERIGAVREPLEARLRELAALVEPRDDYALIHGELGPDHVLVDGRDEPVLIDIEGAMFFDVEWEHVFLRIRFGDHYERLRVPGLDERRMRLYALAQHLSLVAGPLRLLDGDFPDREAMMGIARFHTEEALRFAGRR